MREILFRGFHPCEDGDKTVYVEGKAVKGRWVEGYPLIDNAVCNLKKIGKCICKHDGSYAAILEWDNDRHEYQDLEVLPSTICQYTGLQDEDGVKIFTNDILRLADTDSGCEWIAVVEFGNPNYTYNWGYQLYKIKGECKNTDILLWVDVEDGMTFAEIIGNTHEEGREGRTD